MIKTPLHTPVKPEEAGGTLRFLYKNPFGRVILRLLRAKWISKLAGAFLNTRFSKFLIKSFVENNGIDLSEYECDNFNCFNDCFCRKIKPGMRPFDEDEDALAAPCDGLLSAYKIESGAVYPVKQSEYTVESLLRNRALADEFYGGYMYVFRLCVNHYHRYHYPVNGKKGANIRIGGTLHTVRPIALESRAVFCENSREYTVIDSESFGRIVQMEVGAMLVGKIRNLHGEKAVAKGEEKGMFLYGGSTVILLTGNFAKPIEEFLTNTKEGLETPVKAGERINE
ncbi:MAG: phosphatidylserine decarboxylase [Clostridia bacterium]|nr:phosphatidylserine decarboxylase [Clostridia bacterium]